MQCRLTPSTPRQDSCWCCCVSRAGRSSPLRYSRGCSTHCLEGEALNTGGGTQCRWWHSLQVVALSTDGSTWYRGWHSVQAVALSAGGSTQYSQDCSSQCLKELPLRDDQLEVHSSSDGCIPSERPAMHSKQASIGLFSGSGNT